VLTPPRKNQIDFALGARLGLAELLKLLHGDHEVPVPKEALLFWGMIIGPAQCSFSKERSSASSMTQSKPRRFMSRVLFEVSRMSFSRYHTSQIWYEDLLKISRPALSLMSLSLFVKFVVVASLLFVS
jgi:hypothetical protein